MAKISPSPAAQWEIGRGGGVETKGCVCARKGKVLAFSLCIVTIALLHIPSLCRT